MGQLADRLVDVIHRAMGVALVDVHAEALAEDLLKGADIDESVMQALGEHWHVGVYKSAVIAHRVSCEDDAVGSREVLAKQCQHLLFDDIQGRAARHGRGQSAFAMGLLAPFIHVLEDFFGLKDHPVVLLNWFEVDRGDHGRELEDRVRLFV